MFGLFGLGLRFVGRHFGFLVGCWSFVLTIVLVGVGEFCVIYGGLHFF